jgi:hypothetical protein
MACSCWITTSHGALLEVALEDVTPGEGVVAQNTHVRTVSSICEGQQAN